MFFNKRRRFNGDVAILLPAFGFTLDDAGSWKTLDVLDLAWAQKYSVYEAALFVAYLTYIGMAKKGASRADFVKRQIDFVQEEWINKGVVRKDLVLSFADKSRNALHGDKGRIEPTIGDIDDVTVNDFGDNDILEEFDVAPDMPDIVKKEPVRAYSTNQYLLFLLSDVPPIASRTGENVMSLHYKYVMLVIDERTGMPCLYVTLEKGAMGGSFLCTFKNSKSRVNLGDGAKYEDINAFEKIALSSVRESLNLSPDDISRMPAT